VILKSLTPINYGPFSVPASISFEPDVTVLTGANDTGKTSVLQLIHRICTVDAPVKVKEEEFNVDNMHAEQRTWEGAADFGATVVFARGQKPFPVPQHNAYQEADELTVRICISPNNRSQVIQGGRRGDTNFVENVPFGQLPKAVLLPPAHDLSNIINLAEPNPLESNLITLMFGPSFYVPQLTTASSSQYLAQLERAGRRLTDVARPLFPPSFGLRISVRADPGHKDHICLLLEDTHGSLTAFGQRGAGVRRVISLICALLGQDLESNTVYILIDEPETSLHADAQHLLRVLLEHLASKPNRQVIYTTHFPSMINVLRPHAIRLFHRAIENGKPTSKVTNRPFKDGYLPVRASLGLTPADSLLYAPVTVVVEGDTEVIGIPLLLRKLADSKTKPFDEQAEVLNQVAFLDGMGDRFPFVVRLVKSQGAKPVIFLDGDKARHPKNTTLDAKDSDVPIVTLDVGKEFEQLVPEDVYIAAVAEHFDADPTIVSAAAFKEWERTAKLNPKMMFRKRVNRWLESLDLPDLQNAAIMRIAIEKADPATIDTRPLTELLDHINRLLRGGVPGSDGRFAS
jgi:predicted ATPase